MPTMHFPRQFEAQLKGQISIDVPHGKLLDIVHQAMSEFPAARHIFLDDRGELAPFIYVFVNGVAIDANSTRDTYLSAGCEVVFVNAVAGG